MTKRRGDAFEEGEDFREIRQSFARRLRQLRSERGFSQKQFAELSDISQPHMGAIEAGLPNVSLSNIARMARALGVPIPALFEGTAGAKSGVEAILVRLVAELERANKYLETRRDEIGRAIDELNDQLARNKTAKDALARLIEEETKPAETPKANKPKQASATATKVQKSKRG
jgi:transcriptional regulator with XRE-family HTH domain